MWHLVGLFAVSESASVASTLTAAAMTDLALSNFTVF